MNVGPCIRAESQSSLKNASKISSRARVAPSPIVPAGQGFAQTEDVGADPRLFAGEPVTGAPEAGRDLIGDEEDVVFFCQRMRAPPAPWGRGIASRPRPAPEAR